MARFSLAVSWMAFASRLSAYQLPFGLQGKYDIDIGSNWYVLGPFQSGTREQQWGADPLEAYGGFRNLTSNDTQLFPSSLNGTVHFDTTTALPVVVEHGFLSRKVPVTFQDVNWTLLEKAFGWSALQFQAWIRGTIHVGVEGRYGIWIGSAVEFYLDGVYYDVGNLYDPDVVQYSRGGLFLDMKSGEHTLEIRVVNDIRAFGGQKPPRVEVQIAIRKVEEDLVVAHYESHGGWVVPTVINMTRKYSERGDVCLAGHWGSVAVRNEGRRWIVITGLTVNEDDESQIDGPEDYIRLAPGQQRPISFKIHRVIKPFDLSVHIIYNYLNDTKQHTRTFTHPLSVINDILKPHQFTHLHPSGTVTSAIIKPPKSLKKTKVAYMLFALHGAGVENNSPFWAEDAYRGLDDINAFIIQPSGVTSWGDDWHDAWSFNDVESSRAGAYLWSISISPCMPLDYQFFFWAPAIVTGHSNGGQGVWYALTHWSDLNLWAGNPISGYSSIPAYIPYTLWQPLDGKKALIRDIALRSYDHALLAENAVPFTIHVRHGSDDGMSLRVNLTKDNVPVWHSRRLVESVKERGGNITYDEVPGAGHWYDGIMTSGSVGQFLSNVSSAHPFIRPLSTSFLIANPREMGQRGDIKVEQLISWRSLGRVELRQERITTPLPLEVMRINTTNVRRLTVMDPFRLDVLYIDGQYIPCGQTLCLSLFRDDETGKWKNENFAAGMLGETSAAWVAVERHARQLGPLAAIMDTPGPLTIVTGRKSVTARFQMERIASSIAQNLFVYFGADVDIRFDDEVDDSLLSGNVITLGMEDENQYLQQVFQESHLKHEFPIQTGSQKIKVSDAGQEHTYSGEDVGAIYLHPLPRSRLLLSICGTDREGLERAAKLFPYRTGVGQPDWVIVGPEMGVQGMQGVKAMGFYSNEWDIETAVSDLR